MGAHKFSGRPAHLCGSPGSDILLTGYNNDGCVQHQQIALPDMRAEKLKKNTDFSFALALCFLLVFPASLVTSTAQSNTHTQTFYTHVFFECSPVNLKLFFALSVSQTIIDKLGKTLRGLHVISKDQYLLCSQSFPCYIIAMETKLVEKVMHTVTKLKCLTFTHWPS